MLAEREVSTAEGVELAKAWGIPFFEASAKTSVNNFAQFEKLVKEILYYRHLPAEALVTKKKNCNVM